MRRFMAEEFRNRRRTIGSANAIAKPEDGKKQKMLEKPSSTNRVHYYRFVPGVRVKRLEQEFTGSGN